MRSPIVSLLFMMLVGLCSFKSNATTLIVFIKPVIAVDSITRPEAEEFQSSEINLYADQKGGAIDSTEKKKIVSALFALPFPFGFMGAHRVILGCKPWIPVVYVATFGGCFGLLPLIDFFVITFSKDITQYENNPRIFMWIK